MIRIEPRRWGLSLTAELGGARVGSARAVRIADGSAAGVPGPVWRISVSVSLQRQGVGIDLFAAAVSAADGPILSGDRLRAAGLAREGTTPGGRLLWGSRRLAGRVEIRDEIARRKHG